MHVDPGGSLRAIARAHVRRNAFVGLSRHGRAMPGRAFSAIVALLLCLRLGSIAVMIVAAGGWLTDPGTWPIEGEIHAPLATPFHGFANPFGPVFQLFVAMHGITGALLFAVCFVPLLARKGGTVHVIAGRAFVALWLVHLIDGLANSSRILIARGFDPTHYLDAPGRGFSLYLYLQFAFISSMVIDFLAHGLAALHYKNRPPARSVRAVMLFLPITSLALGVPLALWGAARLVSLAVGGEPPSTPSEIPFAVTYLVQVPPYVYLIARNVQYWLRPAPRAWLHGWITEHQRNLTFCVQVTLYTGVANVTFRFAPALTPFLFAAIDFGFLAWIVVKERAIRRAVVGSRLGLAFVAAVRGRAPAPRAEISSVDARWIVKMFDLDRSGSLELGEIRTLLAEQGIVLGERELARVHEGLDRNGDGRVEPRELAAFLAGFFVPAPTPEDELALAFRLLDRDGDGRITEDELRAALAAGDDALHAIEIEGVLDAVDRDGSGAIEWEEFVAAMRPSIVPAQGRAA